MENADRLYCGTLLNALQGYGSNRKAEIVYRKCLRAGKMDLARKIKFKYALRTEIMSDQVMAFAMSLGVSTPETK